MIKIKIKSYPYPPLGWFWTYTLYDTSYPEGRQARMHGAETRWEIACESAYRYYLNLTQPTIIDVESLRRVVEGLRKL